MQETTPPQDYFRIFLTGFLLTILIIPILSTIVRRKTRVWLAGGIEGDNQKLDMSEIWEMIYMYIAVGSFLLFVYMIVNKTHNNVAYTWEEYTLSFLGTAGSNGVSAWIIYVKNKFKK